MIQRLARSIAERYRRSRWARWTCDVAVVGAMFLAIAVVHGWSGLRLAAEVMQFFGNVER